MGIVALQGSRALTIAKDVIPVPLIVSQSLSNLHPITFSRTSIKSSVVKDERINRETLPTY